MAGSIPNSIRIPRGSIENWRSGLPLSRLFRRNFLDYDRSSTNLCKYKTDLRFLAAPVQRDRYDLPSGGLEHDVQIGFGWTNDVILDLLKTYGGEGVSALAEEN